jgi:integrase-like protein
LFATVRLAELVALDVEDVRRSARKGVLVIQSGKGDSYREVPLNALARQVLDEWLEQRKRLAAEDERALFVAARGARLSARATDSAVRKVARDAGLDLSTVLGSRTRSREPAVCIRLAIFFSCLMEGVPITDMGIGLHARVRQGGRQTR